MGNPLDTPFGRALLSGDPDEMDQPQAVGVDVDTIEPAPGDSPEDIAREMIEPPGPTPIQKAVATAQGMPIRTADAMVKAAPGLMRQGAAPPPRPAGPPPVRVPPQYAGQMGGYYYGPDKDAWLSGLETDRLTESNGVTDANAQKAIAQREQWEQSVPGRIADLERTKQAGMQRVGGYQRGAMELHSAGQAAQAHEMAEYREQEDRRFKSAQARRKRMMDDYQAQMERYARANDAISQSKIDPERFWNSKTTGSKISSAIFLGLGAAGAIAGGGPNYALQILDKQIGRDIDAQKHNLANKRAGLAGQQSLLGMMRQHYDTEEQAEAATRAHAYRQLQNKVETIGKTTNSLITRQKSAELGARLQAAAELSEKNLGVMAAKLSAAAEQARINAANQAAQRRAELEEAKRRATQGYFLDPAKDAKYVLKVPTVDANGRYALTYTKVDPVSGERTMPDLKRMSAAAIDYNNRLNRAKQIMSMGRVALATEPQLRDEMTQLLLPARLEFQKKITGVAGSPEQMEEIRRSMGAGFGDLTEQWLVDKVKSLEVHQRLYNEQLAPVWESHGAHGTVIKAPDLETGGREGYYYIPSGGAQRGGGATLYDSPE